MRTSFSLFGTNQAPIIRLDSSICELSSEISILGAKRIKCDNLALCVAQFGREVRVLVIMRFMHPSDGDLAGSLVNL